MLVLVATGSIQDPMIPPSSHWVSHIEKLGPSQQNFKHDNVSDPSFPLNMTETTANHSVWPWSKCFFGTTCFAEVSLQEECVILLACCLRHLLATFCKVSKIEIFANFSVYHPCVHSLQTSISTQEADAQSLNALLTLQGLNYTPSKDLLDQGFRVLLGGL